jgi:hypothetical protein
MNGVGGRYLPAAYTQMTNPQLRMNKMKYHRTMNEAFPHTVEYGAAIEIHVAQHSTGDKVIRVLALVALIVICLDIFIWRP